MKINKILLGILILIFLINNVNAFGVASTFAGRGPVVVEPGKSEDVVFSIQNGGGATEDVVAKIEILEGKEIVELIEDNEYLVPAGGGISATIRVKVPENAKEDDKYNIRLSFKVIPSSESGGVDMGYGVITSFDVVTKEPEKIEIPTGEVVKETTPSNLPITLVVIVIAGIAIYLYEKKKKNK